MKKILLVMILAGITRAEYGCAQRNPERVFDLPQEIFGRQFTVELDRGNKMQVSVTTIRDLDYISNIDSMVKLFRAEFALLRDTLAGSGYSRRIDYNMDQATVKKIRLRRTKLDGNYFAIINGAPARLKLQQDTVVLTGKIPPGVLRKGRANREPHYFCVTFYLNDINDLAGYKEGWLNDMIKTMQQYYNGDWQYRLDDQLQLKKFPEITSATAKGYIFHSPSFYLKKAVEVQNYKDRFVPSVSVMPVFVKNGDFTRREFGLDIDACFAFAKTVDNAVKTFVNVFVGIAYSVIPSVPNPRSKLYPHVQLDYLVHRRGQAFDKNSFRFSLGRFRFNQFTTMIEPAVYFNNFFKNTSPSLRVVQKF